MSAYYGLPPEVRFCTKCSISNQRPCSTVEYKNEASEKKETIDWHAGDVCGACILHASKEEEIDWEDRDRRLRELCDRFRSDDGTYDCILPGSGGKDSSMTAHLLKYKYGMHPLTVTWTPHIYSEAGFRNFQRWIHAGFDNELHSPNGRVHRLLTKLAYTNMCHPFQPFILGQKNIGVKTAIKHKVPLIFYGEPEAEYNGVSKRGDGANEAKRDLSYSAAHRDGLMDFRLGGVAVRDLLETYDWLSLVDLEPYLPINTALAENLGVEVHYLGYYVKWDPQEVYYYCVEHLDFEANDERTEGTYSKYLSFDDRTDGYHYWTTWIKFGIGRCMYDSSQEVRNGKITRDEAVALCKKYDGEFPIKYFREMLNYMDLTADEFFDIADKFRSPHLWRKDDLGNWWLKHTIYGEERMDDARERWKALETKDVSIKPLVKYRKL